MTTDPVIKNLIKAFDGEKITLDTVYEPDGDADALAGATGAVSKMAKRAMNKRS